MKRIWVIGILSACTCRAQPPVKTPAEMQAEFERDLRGGREPSPFLIREDPFWDRTAGQQRPTGQSVSLARLQHKVPKEARKSLARALRLSKTGDHEKAAAELQTAIQRDPEFADAYGQLGVEYGELKRFREAETALRHSLELDPESWLAHYDLGVILVRSGNPAEAEQNVRRALRESGESARVHLLLGYLLWQRPETRAEGLQHVQYAARTIPAAKKFLRSLQEP